LPRQSPTLPRGLEGGNPLCVKIFLEKSLSTKTTFVFSGYISNNPAKRIRAHVSGKADRAEDSSPSAKNNSYSDKQFCY
jgi:hypothetical protein